LATALSRSCKKSLTKAALSAIFDLLNFRIQEQCSPEKQYS